MFINIKYILITFLLFLMAGCQEDLMPSNDKMESTLSTREGEVINDISFTFSDGTHQNLSDELARYDAVVFYFTMWCPICDGHMSYIRNQIKPQYDNVKFVFVDYISGNISGVLDSQESRGYTDFSVIADTDDALEKYFNGSMATTVIIDKNFIVKLNSTFKTGKEIFAKLDGL